VWAWLAELCADVFAATHRARPAPRLRVYAGLAFLVVGSAVGYASSGLRGLVPAGLLALFALVLAGEVLSARESVVRAALLPLDQPGQRPRRRAIDRFTAPSAVTLNALAAAIDSARRGRFAEANDLCRLVQRDLLHPAEARLLDATRAMVSLGLGDRRRAAQQAAAALPTGCAEIDATVGRAILAEAWMVEERLRAIDAAWGAAGVGEACDDVLPRLRALVRARLDPPSIAALPAVAAQELADEARALGDLELASELAARGRSGAYR
jgi:hypothetical protein